MAINFYDLKTTKNLKLQKPNLIYGVRVEGRRRKNRQKARNSAKTKGRERLASGGLQGVTSKAFPAKTQETKDLLGGFCVRLDALARTQHLPYSHTTLRVTKPRTSVVKGF